MKVYITGSTGFIGKHLMKLYPDALGYNRGDDVKGWLNRYKPDVIINSAAEIYDSENMFEPNIVLTYQCLEYVKKNPAVKMIQIGSSSEYGPKAKASAETDMLNPIDFYQGTKAAATMMCQGLARQFDLNVCIARPYSVYGPGEKPHRLFPRLWKAFMKNEPMKLFDGEHDFIYIDDFVRGINLLANHDSIPSGDVINFGSGIQTSNLEVLDLFVRVTDRTAPVELVSFKQKRFETEIWRCDTTYAKERYEFQTHIDLKLGIELFLQQADY
jgi:nucleoside-diphosphate-sugar epimerase